MCHWSYNIGHWIYVIGHMPLVICHWPYDMGHWAYVIGHMSLITTSFDFHNLCIHYHVSTGSLDQFCLSQLSVIPSKAIGLIFYVYRPSGIRNRLASKGKKTHTEIKHEYIIT